MKKEKRASEKVKFVLTLTIVCSLGMPFGFAGGVYLAKLFDDWQSQVDRKNYGDMYDLMLKSNGRVVTLEKYDEPITVSLAQNFSENEKKQIVNAIESLDAISPSLNYTILENDKYSIMADINIDKGKDAIAEHALAQTYMRYNSKAKITYPISITLDEEFSNCFGNYTLLEDNLLCRVMKHEMMHTLGFADLYDEKHFDKSIMWYSIGNAGVVKDYTERDKYCINKIYDGDTLVTVNYPSELKFSDCRTYDSVQTAQKQVSQNEEELEF